MNSDKSASEICRRIREESQKEVNELIRRAGEKAAAREKQAREEAARVSAEIIRRAEAEAASEARKLLAKAELESRRVELKGREELISMVMQRVRQKIASIRSSPDYPDILERLIAGGISELGASEVDLMAPDEARKFLTKKYLERIEGAVSGGRAQGISLRLVDERIEGTGVVLRARNGRAEVNNTLEERLRRSTVELRLLVWNALFS